MTIQRFRANARLYSRRLSTPTGPYYWEPGSIADLDVGYATPEVQCTPDEIEMLIGNGYISRVTDEEIAAWEAENAPFVSDDENAMLGHSVEGAPAAPAARRGKRVKLESFISDTEE